MGVDTDKSPHGCILVIGSVALATIAVIAGVACALVATAPIAPDEAGGVHGVPVLASLWKAMHYRLQSLLLLHTFAWVALWGWPATATAGRAISSGPTMEQPGAGATADAETIRCLQHSLVYKTIVTRSLGPMTSAALAVLSIGLYLAWSNGSIPED